MPPTETPQEKIAPWVVLAVMLLITALATRYVWDNSRRAAIAEFQNDVGIARTEIEARIDTYVNVLRAATGLFAADEDVTRDQFREYIRALQVRQRYPGVLGIGLSIRVPQNRVSAVVSDIRANERPDFRIWPEEPARDEYHTIVLLEPLEPENEPVIGFDMFTNLARREAMIRARDTGSDAATGRVRLIQETDPRQPPGFLIFLPVYNERGTPRTVEERRQRLYGFVYAPFRARDFFQSVLRERTDSDLDFAISDGDQTMYTTDGAAQSDSMQRATETIDVAGRKWNIVFSSTRRVSARPGRYATATASGGIALSLLLFVLVRGQSRARAAAEQTAEKLRQSESELQKAARAKDEFLATLSHELRTPMTAILGWSKLLADDLDEESYKSAVDAIQKSGKAQAQLIDDLLDVSRITSGKMRIETRPLDLAPIARAAAGAVAPAAHSKGVALKIDVPASPVLVNGDSARLQQVIWNLLSNAVKFTPRDGEVKVNLSENDGQAVLRVTDSGQGIEAEFLPHVFERFRQADSSTTRAHAGLGLGLAIVRHLAELHGGTVTAESDGLGKGASFTVRLPLLHVLARADDAERRDDSAALESLQKAKILIVDDEEDVRNYAGAVFRMSGSDVRCVKSVPDALETLSRWQPDVIVSDLGLPGMDGYEFLRRIRSMEPVANVPVVALTAYARPEDREAVELAGFDAYISKPVGPNQLRVAVAEVLSAVHRQA